MPVRVVILADQQSTGVIVWGQINTFLGTGVSKPSIFVYHQVTFIIDAKPAFHRLHVIVMYCNKCKSPSLIDCCVRITNNTFGLYFNWTNNKTFLRLVHKSNNDY